MKIHSDKLTQENLLEHVPAGVTLQLSETTSTKRLRGFEAQMKAEPGEDAHGVARRYVTQSNDARAATWVEYGDWMVELLKIDADAIIGTYNGVNDFIVKTHEAASSRPSFEDAEAAADRWSEEIFWSNQAKLGAVKVTRVRDEVDPALAQKEAALRHQGIDPASMTDDEIDGAFGIPVCPECSSEEVSRADEGRTFVCGNCGARFDNPLLAAS